MVSEQEFKSLEGSLQTVIMVKTDDSIPSGPNPVSKPNPFSSPGRPISVSPFCKAPVIINQNQALGAGANLGEAAEFKDQCTVSKN